MNNFKIIGAFYVPFIKIKFENHHQYNFPIFIEKKNNIPSGWEGSVHTSFLGIPENSNFIGENEINILKDDIEQDIKKTFIKLNLPDSIYFQDFWYNIYHENQGQGVHNHLSTVDNKFPYWSGIYYYKNSSPTIFKKPYSNHQTCKFHNWEKSALAPCFFDTFHPDIEDGDILLFPPYLEHFVKSGEYNKNNMRVTFAFNIGLY